ncbi:hypothetical protein N7527_010816 [Penicillium freii]|nr:hypothetical protein N7527_010816 [Penicillium freii]
MPTPYIIPGGNRPMPPRPLIDIPTTVHINPFCQLDLSKRDYSLKHHACYIDCPVTELPTPALILSKPMLERNTQLLLEDVKRLRIEFRPHVKTLKCTEVTRMMLGDGVHRRIVASTLSEILGFIGSC